MLKLHWPPSSSVHSPGPVGEKSGEAREEEQVGDGMDGGDRQKKKSKSMSQASITSDIYTTFLFVSVCLRMGSLLPLRRF